MEKERSKRSKQEEQKEQARGAGGAKKRRGSVSVAESKLCCFFSFFSSIHFTNDPFFSKSHFIS